MSKSITREEQDKLAISFGYDPKALNAVVHVETPGYGFHKTTGNIIINFEPHIFKNYSKIIIPDGDGTQTSQWIAYEKAKKLYPKYALLSTSWGMGQIMGFNFLKAGYVTVEDMVNHFRESEHNQLLGMLSFIRNHPRLHKAFLALDWRTFSFYYNGEKYYLNNYDQQLKTAYDHS